MGYMGLEHWNLSDTACDFFCDLEENKDWENLISKQIFEYNGPYNTSGAINVALLIEDGKIKNMSTELHNKLITELRRQLYGIQYNQSWAAKDLDNWNYHVESYERLLDSAVANINVE